MRLLSVAILAIGCREQKAAPVQAVDSGSDTLAAAIADLEDVGDAPIYAHDVTIVAVKVEPTTALTDARETLTKERWRFRSCAKHITQPTETSVTVRVGEGGEVISSTAEASGELSRCLTDGAQKLKFSEPNGGHASLDIALKYAPR
jgi:hypothetical protein